MGCVVIRLKFLKMVQKKKFTKLEKKYSENVPNGYGLSHRVVFQKLIDSQLKLNKKLPTRATESYNTIKLINMMYKSSELDRWVYYNEKNIKSKLGH